MLSNDLMNLYEVKIYSTSTNIEINTIQGVNIQIQDFNGNPIANKNITVTCDKGIFTQWSNNDSTGNNLHSLNNVKSFTGTTDSTGWFDCTYKATEWGLCTLSCDVEKLQIFVKGFKQLSISSTKNWETLFQVDESTRHCRLRWKYNDASISLNSTAKIIDTITLPKEEYYPNSNINKTTYNSRVNTILSTNGNIYLRTIPSYTTTMAAHYEYFEWHY